MTPVEGAVKLSAKDKKFVVGQIDTRTLSLDALEMYCNQLISGYDPDFYTDSGKRKALADKLRSLGANSFDEIDKKLNEKREAARNKVPKEFLALTTEDLKDLTNRIGMVIDFDKYNDATMYRVASRLHKRATKEGLTIEQIRLQEPKADGRATRMPILFEDQNNIPTTAPHGVPQYVIDIFQNHKARLDANAVLGRSAGKRPLAVIKSSLPANDDSGESVIATILIVLPSQYELPQEKAKIEKTADISS